MPKDQLPPDAERKGFEEKTVQDLILKPHVIRFRREKFYSPSLKKTYLAPLPTGFDDGDLGPALVSYIHFLHWQAQVSSPNILKVLDGMGFVTSEGKISKVLTQGLERFHTERDEIHRAGLESSPWQQIDDTFTRVDGKKHSCHVLCNPLYSFYATLPDKSRLSVLDVLRNIDDVEHRRFRVNEEAFRLLSSELWVKNALIEVLSGLPQDIDFTKDELLTLIGEGLQKRALGALGVEQERRILNATAIASYHAMKDYPVVRLLICDDAPQFKLLTEDLLLCWIHEGRHYKKLVPFLAPHQALLDDFIKRYWDFYDRLKVFQETPTSPLADILRDEFAELFSTRTGYEDLDKRIEATKQKSGRLLHPVLNHPELPLHNNDAELSIRRRVRKRDVSFGDVSFGPRSEAGRRAWDTFLTLCETTRKLGLSFWDYLQDRFTRAQCIPRLGRIIEQKARQRPIALSW
jgi:hypothetical protein